MDQRVTKRLLSLLFSALLCLMLPSCGFFSAVWNEVDTRREDVSDFRRYAEYLQTLNEEKNDVYDGYGYTAFADTCYVKEDLCIRLGGTTRSLGAEDGLTYYITAVLVIPEGDKEIHYGFQFSRENTDGSETNLVSGSGTLMAKSYQGKLPLFTEYEDFVNQSDIHKVHYHEMATREMERLLDAAAILLDRAGLTVAALGFPYTPPSPETNQSVSHEAYSDITLCLSPSHTVWMGEISNSYGGNS